MAINTEGFGSIVSGIDNGGNSAVTYNNGDQTTIIANRQGVTNASSTGASNTQFSVSNEGGSIDGTLCGALSGEGHTVQGLSCVVTGGSFNQILNTVFTDANFCFNGGGNGNSISGLYTSVVGGQYNHTSDETGVAYYGFIGGGFANSIRGEHTIIVGGLGNQIIGANGGFIGGGFSNVLSAVSTNFDNGYSVIGGGKSNTVWGQMNVVTGGQNNSIGNSLTDTDHSVIAGGLNNSIQEHYGFIGSGNANTINLGAEYANIPGGLGNVTAEKYTTALGVQAEARTMSGVTQAGGAFINEAGWRQRTTAVFRADVQGPGAGTLGTGGFNGTTETTLISVPASTSSFFRAECVARALDGVTKVVILEGLIVMDDAGAMTDTLSSVATYELGSPPSEWDFNISALSGGFEISFIAGMDSSLVKTVASVALTEVRYPSS